jgi:hypothetical protein
MTAFGADSKIGSRAVDRFELPGEGLPTESSGRSLAALGKAEIGVEVR